MLNKAPFPSAIDNTMVSAFRACPKKFFWRHGLWLQKNEQSIHLVSGGAFAKGLEVTRKEFFDNFKPFNEALARGACALIAAFGNTEPSPKYGAKNVFNMIGALAFYFETWPIDRIITPYQRIGQRHEIEWNFAVPIGITNPSTGAPILYCGRFDMIGQHESGMILGEDDKTTSQLGESWFNRWRLSNQLIGYTWGVREHGIALGGFNIRGVSLLKNSYGHADAICQITPQKVDLWLINTQLTVNRMIQAYLNNAWELDMAGACSAYGGCDYLPLCEANDPEDWIEPNYHKIEWNPLASRD